MQHAREHNLKDVSLTIPHGQIVVVTGPSGSGKSTLAFDVVFAEGQRHFLETLTPYARQFLPSLPRPDVDRVVGVPPAIALEQRTARSGATSSVATVTEIAQYLRLLFAKVGEPYCPRCDAPITSSTPDEAFERVCALSGNRALFAPVVRSRKGTHLDVFTAAARSGIATAVVDGTFGAGGYRNAVLAAGAGHVYAFDRDPTAIAAGEALAGANPDRLTLIHERFSLMDRALEARGVAR